MARRLFNKFLRTRARLHHAFVKAYIVGERVLEIGAAEGWIGAEIKRDDPAREVLLLDVADLNTTDLSLVLYDGENFPFPDGRFDTSLLMLTLHHCGDPDRVLDEAIRVTRRRLIVTESVYNHRPGRALLWVLDTLVNAVRSRGRMSRALHFRTVEEWQATFRRRGLRLLEQKWFSRGVHKHVLFVLTPDGDAD